MRFRLGLMVAAVLSVQAGGTSAAVYSDDMAKCLVGKTSEADKNLLMQWLVGLIGINPAVRDIIRTTPEQRTVNDRKVGALFDRLLMSDCRKETVDALKYEGAASLETSFGLLGQAAMRGLMSDPAVEKASGSFTEYLDTARLNKVFEEAGIRPNAAAK